MQGGAESVWLEWHSPPALHLLVEYRATVRVYDLDAKGTSFSCALLMLPSRSPLFPL